MVLPIGALDRVLARMQGLLAEIHRQYVADLEAKAEERFADNGEAWDRYFAREVNKRCPFAVNLTLHSMGNYLFKNLLKSSAYGGDRLLLDNMVLSAADTNSEGHAEWIDGIQCRNRVYVTINENDVALRASRMKIGELQKVRLGHYLRGLDSRVAAYVDFTGQPHVGDLHAYFEGKPLINTKVKAFSNAALNGAIGEAAAHFDPARNVYRV